MRGERCEPEGGRAWSVVAARQAACTGGEGPTQGLGAKGTRGAHPEHVAHGHDAGGVEAQRLVEGRRVLPSPREGMRCGGERCEAGGGRAWGVVAARQEACTGEGPTQGLGAKGTRRAHAEHVAHVSDTGGVEAQRLVEGRRGLPSPREGMGCGGERCEPGGGSLGLGCGGGTQGACTGNGPTQGLGAKGTRGERT